jgi:hypothetical protein
VRILPFASARCLNVMNEESALEKRTRAARGLKPSFNPRQRKECQEDGFIVSRSLAQAN